jgi:hypothetical protein
MLRQTVPFSASDTSSLFGLWETNGTAALQARSRPASIPREGATRLLRMRSLEFHMIGFKQSLT